MFLKMDGRKGVVLSVVSSRLSRYVESHKY
jgi:hypothetical protein